MGLFHGMNTSQAPQIQDKKRTLAIVSVKNLFQGFIERFGDTDCQTLTGCDWSKEEDRNRFNQEQSFVKLHGTMDL